MSPSSRRAWIEIQRDSQQDTKQDVALLAEGVDRNIGGLVNWPSEEVALLAEGVDRNTLPLVELAAVLGRPPRGGRG